jgi:hypothetical protein
LIVPQPSLKYEVLVTEKGRVELDVPFPPGARLTVFIVQEPADPFDDLTAAAESSLDFWDNPLDDEDWNNA